MGAALVHKRTYKATEDGRCDIVGVSLELAGDVKRLPGIEASPVQLLGRHDARDDAGRARPKAAREGDGGVYRDVRRERPAAEPAAGLQVARPDEVVLPPEALGAAVYEKLDRKSTRLNSSH